LLINNAYKNTGVGRYAFEIQENLIDSEVQIDHYLFNRNRRSLDRYTEHGCEIICKKAKKPIFDNALLMKLDKLPNLILDYRLGKYVPDNYDLYHITNQTICNIGYYRNISRKIITVHDLIFYVYSSNYLKKILSKVVYQGLHTSDYIISDSESTKKDIIKYFKIPEKKIKVIYLGVSTRFRQLPFLELSKLFVKYGLEQDCQYVLHVGRPEPRKNLITLLKAFKKMLIDSKLNSVRLLKINALSKQEERAVIEFGLQKYVRVLKSVPEDDLISLYNIADVFVFPSYYEGFGFPPLEAMACGTPVITSNSSSIPEIVSDAGILVDPNDEDGFANAIHEVLKDNTLQNEMTLKGLVRARLFNWQKTARETLDIYRIFM
jgi:glycosyltransferase involved in cell wall biosynthesis